MHPAKRLLLVGPAIAAFLWWLVRRGPDVDAWTAAGPPPEGDQGEPKR